MKIEEGAAIQESINIIILKFQSRGKQPYLKGCVMGLWHQKPSLFNSVQKRLPGHAGPR